MEHVMIDFETRGTRAGCAVLSLGAVFFDAQNLGHEFYRVVDAKDCARLGLFSEQSTMDWWSKQNEAARAVLAESESGAPHVVAVARLLEDFNAFTKMYHAKKESGWKVKVWGNGAGFDNAILENLYAVTGVKSAFPFWNARCYRTLKNCLPGPKINDKDREVYHNGLDDAKVQARHLQQLLAANPHFQLG